MRRSSISCQPYRSYMYLIFCFPVIWLSCAVIHGLPSNTISAQRCLDVWGLWLDARCIYTVDALKMAYKHRWLTVPHHWCECHLKLWYPNIWKHISGPACWPMHCVWCIYTNFKLLCMFILLISKRIRFYFLWGEILWLDEHMLYYNHFFFNFEILFHYILYSFIFMVKAYFNVLSWEDPSKCVN